VIIGGEFRCSHCPRIRPPSISSIRTHSVRDSYAGVQLHVARPEIAARICSRKTLPPHRCPRRIHVLDDDVSLGFGKDNASLPYITVDCSAPDGVL
jgi:hypothetical protein